VTSASDPTVTPPVTVPTSVVAGEVLAVLDGAVVEAVVGIGAISRPENVAAGVRY